ncbi:glycosyltransferase [Palleronia sp. KMU-117]|uniref:glycosyltransferase n=1 Tax=Palleronia sp. KMU-117 TaxID=3434108 RepID=UPI003D72282E
MTDARTTPVDLEGDIDRRLAEISGPRPRGLAKWSVRQALYLWAYVLFFWIALTWLPNHLFDPEVLQITYVLGAIGIWRYGWWFNHGRRSEQFMAFRWPQIRRARDRVWAGGWRPRHVHFQMTTYREEPAITRHVIRAILDQVQDEGLAATIWIGTGAPGDEEVITAFVRDYAPDLDTEIVFIRQNQPGKRMAIGLVMRAIIRSGPDPDDLIVFMDGDSILGSGTLARCCAMFGADPELQALTTDEEVVVYGPRWMQRWLDLRFTQRRLAMQSHVLSDRVLTLTGRMSMFRARHIVNEGFVRTIEADHLDHWLWGRFRFLSGDDKSTWYYLLARGAKMGYVPDACVATVEIIHGNGINRMIQNLRRWSGNMLRNGARALALGPRRVPPFIWWCVLDQRIAIWTTLISPTLVFLAVFVKPGYLTGAVLWVLVSRLVLSLYLFRYARRVDLAWPFFLYANQIVNACVKAYLQFFLRRQSWANRGGQTAGEGAGLGDGAKTVFATYQLVTAAGVFIYLVGVLGGMLPLPQIF